MWAGNKAVLRKWQSALGNDTFGIVQIAGEVEVNWPDAQIYLQALVTALFTTLLPLASTMQPTKQCIAAYNSDYTRL